MRTFRLRDKTVMMTLFKSLILSRLDYASQLWSPSRVADTAKLERVQRSFTKRIRGMESLSYVERLQALRLYSLERRRDRYGAIYVWKILEGRAPNLRPELACTHSGRRGRLCVVAQASRGRAGTLLHGSFRHRAARQFNALPSSVRGLTGCSIDQFKTHLDKFLLTIPDRPGEPNTNNALDESAARRWWTLRVGLTE